jgi:hypothetical protein
MTSVVESVEGVAGMDSAISAQALQIAQVDGEGDET